MRGVGEGGGRYCRAAYVQKLNNEQMPLKSCKGSASFRLRKVVCFISLSK